MNSTTHLDELFTLLAFPSISTDREYKADVDRCAEWLTEKLNSIGLAAGKHPTPGHPVVIARNEHRADRKTVLIYGHYDVQPVDPLELWLTPPFEPTVKDGVVFARGSTDNKGQHFAHICGVADTIREYGDLPVNLIFLLEGEEEIGSPHLEPFLKEHADELQCDVIVVSDTGMVGPSVPTLTYGLRGIACLDFTVKGPPIDLHSGIYGGAVANPATVTGELLASLHDKNRRVAIEGFYDDVLPLEPWEREQWTALPDGDAATMKETGVPGLLGEQGYTSLERRWGRPTAEVNGLGGGYQGEGSKTIIPSKAFAKLSFRLVPGQSPEKILRLAESHLRKHCPGGVTIDINAGHVGNAYVMDAHSDFGKAAQSALQKTFAAEPVLIREGGSIPIIDSFKQVLGVDTLMCGLALPNCQAHAPNENFPVANFEAGIRLNRLLLQELAGLP